MEPASTSGRDLSFDPDTLGRPQPWVVEHRGLECVGEVIVSEVVNPDWGGPLDAGLQFRLVFFTVPRRIPRGQIQDRRTAMVVPSRSPARTRPSLDTELEAIRETRARYVTARDLAAPALRQSMDEREAFVRGELARRYAVAFAQGRIYTHSDIRVRSREFFVGDDPASWADRLASAVLSEAYPTVLFDYAAFPGPLRGEQVSAVFGGLFHGDADAAGAAEAFAPGLGLASPETPSLFDASDCRALSIVRRELEARGGQMPAQDMLRVMMDVHGLVGPLALLYLLAFVRQARAEIELPAGHDVASWGGAPFRGNRITWDVVPELLFAESLADNLGTLRLRPSVSWDTVVPYATLLVDGLESAGDAKDAAEQERRLTDALAKLRADISRSREILSELESALGPGSGGNLDVLDDLESLCSAQDYRRFYSVIQDRFRGPSGLAGALDGLDRLSRLASLAPAIGRAKRYLDSMTFQRDLAELLLEHDSVAARFDLEGLMANPSLWSSIKERYESLRGRYVSAYVSHHARYRQDAIELSAELERLRPQVVALTRFSEIPELGEPVGAEIPERFDRLSSSFRRCEAGGDPTLDAGPFCPDCLLPLDEDVPRREAALVFGATQEAMREYNRRLSTHAVRQILARPTKEQLDRFLDLVQAADPSALVNVLDDEVVDFLRRFLRRN